MCYEDYVDTFMTETQNFTPQNFQIAEDLEKTSQHPRKFTHKTSNTVLKCTSKYSSTIN